MLEILRSGLIESDAQVMELAERYGQIVIPNVDENLDLTHWWLMRDDDTEMLYVGTPETFATYIKERAGDAISQTSGNLSWSHRLPSRLGAVVRRRVVVVVKRWRMVVMIMIRHLNNLGGFNNGGMGLTGCERHTEKAPKQE